MRYMLCLTLIVFAATSASLFAGDGAGRVRNSAIGPTPPEMSPRPPRTPRLRFRTGPVCMCGDGGLSEAQISAAEQAREQAKTLQHKKSSVSND